jgi:hypothetical protein
MQLAHPLPLFFRQLVKSFLIAQQLLLLTECEIGDLHFPSGEVVGCNANGTGGDGECEKVNCKFAIGNLQLAIAGNTAGALQTGRGEPRR